MVVGQREADESMVHTAKSIGQVQPGNAQRLVLLTGLTNHGQKLQVVLSTPRDAINNFGLQQNLKLQHTNKLNMGTWQYAEGREKKRKRLPPTGAEPGACAWESSATAAAPPIRPRDALSSFFFFLIIIFYHN